MVNIMMLQSLRRLKGYYWALVQTGDGHCNVEQILRENFEKVFDKFKDFNGGKLLALSLLVYLNGRDGSTVGRGRYSCNLSLHQIHLFPSRRILSDA